MTGLEVITCATFPREGDSAMHDLARAFRAGDLSAFAEVLALVQPVLAAQAGWVFRERTLAVAAPGHLAGSVNAPCERLIAEVARSIPSLVPAPGALVRVADAPQARDAITRDDAAEAPTLEWRVDGLAAGVARILLIDDVVRTGGTLAAARRAAPPGIAERLTALAVFRAEPSVW